MLEFGKLKIEEKTFSRKESKPHGQAYDGIKFRKYKSEKEGAEAVVKDKFIVSDKAWEKLNLDEFALAQAAFDGNVYLLVVEDQDEVKPEATMARVRTKQDGTKLKKGKSFTSEFLVAELSTVGSLTGEFGNQYLALKDVTSEVTGLPSVVKNVFTLSVDSTVDASADTEEENEVAATTASTEDNF